MVSSTNFESLYARPYQGALAKAASYVPDASKLFGQFNQEVFKDGHLTQRFKELIAIAAAHATGCPYCIDIHVKTSKKLNVTKEELFEAIAVSAAVKGYSAFAHGVNSLNAYEEKEESDLYDRAYGERIEQFESINESLYNAFLEFHYQVFKAGAITEKEKLIIAVAISHVTGCAYSIDSFTKRAKSAGVQFTEIAESILVATALKAGSAFAHRVNALNAFEQ